MASSILTSVLTNFNVVPLVPGYPHLQEPDALLKRLVLIGLGGIWVISRWN